MLINEMLAQGNTVTLCKQGEYGNELSFDFSCWKKQFGSGSVGWAIQRSQDTSAYLLPDTEEGTVSTVTLTATETQYAGVGKLEVFFVNDGETEKRISETLNFTIAPSLQDLGEVPSPWESYVDAVHEDAVAAEEARQSAEDSATSASESAQSAQEARQSAEDSATSASESAQSAQEALQSLEDMTATASVDANIGTPSVQVTKTEDEETGVTNLDFAFHNLKGAKGDKGDKGEVDAESLLDVIGLSIVDGKLCITYEEE